MQHKLFALFVSAFLIATLAFAGLAQDTEILRIAFIGTDRAVDQERFDAAVLAADDINTSDDDGVAGPDDTTYQFEIIYYEANTASEVIDAYEDALDDDVIAILGPHDNELADALADLSTRDVPVFLGSPNSPTATNIYRLVADYSTWGQAAGDYIANERFFENIALVNVNTTTAQDGTTSFVDATGDDAIVLEITVEADETDMSSEARSIRDNDADAVFAWLLDGQMEALVDELNRTGWAGEIIFAGLDRDFADRVSVEQIDRMWGVTNWTPNAYDADSQTFVADYRERHTDAPSPSSVAYYDAVLLLADAVADAGDNVSSITTQLNLNDVDGVQGRYINSSIDTVQIIQVIESEFIEAARYDDGSCITCADLYLPDTSDVDVGSNEVYNVGLVAPLDGANEALGEQIEQAVRLAIREINDQGGVVINDTRYTIALRTYNAPDVQSTEDALNRAIEDEVDVVLGPDANGQVLANLFVAADAELTQLVSASIRQVSAGGSPESLFQIIPNDDTLATASANFLLDVREYESFVTVAVRTDYGLDSAETFTDIVEASEDGRIVLALEHDIDEMDMSTIAERILRQDAEVVAVWSPQPAFDDLLTKLEDASWSGTLVYPYVTADFIAGLDVPDGIELISMSGWWATDATWTSIDFARRYTDRYTETPTPEAAAYYDAVYIIAEALGDGETDLQSWLVNATEFVGVQGTYTFDGGEITQDVRVIAIADETVEVISRYRGETCVIFCGD